MEIVPENTLHIENTKHRLLKNKINGAGRPKKQNEIKFGPPPKSFISILLSKNKNIDIEQNDEKEIKTTDIEIEPQSEPTEDYCLERDVSNKRICNGQDSMQNTEKNYHCKHLNCTYSTKYLSNLKIHKRTHTPDYIYNCDKCSFRSKYISSLKTHSRLHKDEKPFTCKYCNYRCNSSSNLKKHNFRKHKNQEKNE